MRTQHHEQRQLCRHGLNCKYLPTNNCRFYHPPTMQNNTLPHQHRQQHNKGERNGHSRNKNSFHSQLNNSYAYTNNGHANTNSNGLQGAKTKQDLTKQLCRDFHKGQCKYADKCERLHQFLFEGPQGLRRLQQHREIPQDPSARLGRVECEGKEVLALRQGGEAVLFEYGFQEGQLSALGMTVGLPAQCEYYCQRERCFYYSSQNETTHYSDMGFQDLQTKETAWITNSHTGKITGMAHWDCNTLLSASIAGDIKVWSKGNQGFVLNKPATEQFLSQYNPHNTPIEILFLDTFTLNQVRITSAGTNDGRLLFWSGSGFEYMEFAVGQRYAKVFKVRLMQVGSGLSAAVLAWNEQKTISAVLLLDLQTSTVTVLKEVDAGEKPIRHLHLLECHEEYVFVGCLRGEVSVYSLREGRKVGAIFHHNAVVDIVCSTLEMKATGVRVHLLYLLEKRTREAEGSFAIYIMQ